MKRNVKLQHELEEIKILGTKSPDIGVFEARGITHLPVKIYLYLSVWF